MAGSAYEWVQDCYRKNYLGAPADGSPVDGACPDERRVARGGSWTNDASTLRSAKRGWYASDRRSQFLGFRIARSLNR